MSDRAFVDTLIFEDNHLLVLNKPAGLMTQPSGTKLESLENLAKVWLKETYHKRGNVFLQAAHRIDKPVSGLVVFAKTSKALSRLQATIREKKCRKWYCAIVEGSLWPEEGRLEHWMRHDDFMATLASREDPRGKQATLTYRRLRSFEKYSLVEIELETGRYHQIRLQFQAIGHPIVGDIKYGAHLQCTSEAIALHHRRLWLPHPVKESILELEAPLPVLFHAFN